MKLLLVGLLLLSFNVSASKVDYDVFIKSGAVDQLTADLKEALDSSEVELIKHIHLYRQNEDTSFIRLSTASMKDMKALRETYVAGRLNLIPLWQGMVIRALEIFTLPSFISHMAMKEIPVVTYGYFKLPRAYELKHDYLNIYRLKFQTINNVKLFKEIAKTAPSGVGTEQINQATAVHTGFRGALKTVHPSKILGVACGQLFCSCYGVLGCQATMNACKELHSSAEVFMCNTKDRDGKCNLGTCRIFEGN